MLKAASQWRAKGIITASETVSRKRNSNCKEILPRTDG